MKKIILLLTSLVLALSVLTACTSTGSTATAEYDTIKIVYYPNESANSFKDARESLGAAITEATGKKVEHLLTTDYSIAIETIVNNNAHLAFMGASGYIEARNKNEKIEPIFVNSGKSGTLEDAIYYSWLMVNKGEEGQYLSGGNFSIDNIQGKRFSFVSNSSTSGFVVPTTGIISYFSKMPEWSSLKTEDLIKGGSDKFFSEVLFGGSHQGAAVNLLNGHADIASVADTVLNNYVELVQGEANSPGAVYRVKNNAAEPFNNFPGREFVLISVTPVLNAPFVMNTSVLNEEDQNAIIEHMTSDKVANDPKIFVPKDSDFKGMFTKTANERFVAVEDSWFDPIRELGKGSK